MPLSDRQTAILKAILTEHITTAKAVSSKVLASDYELDLSPASIRNEMAELADLGYLSQPHTSAGRMPTVKAYRYYVQHLLHEGDVPRKSREALATALKREEEPEQRAKAVARTVADLSNSAVIMAFTPRNVYATGLAHLLHAPEFADAEFLYHLTEVVDRLDDVIGSIYNDIGEQPTILLGRENPFGVQTAALIMKCQPRGAESERLFGILGPVRMPYDNHLALLRAAMDAMTDA